MARHVANELSFEVPAGWEDRSVVAYAAPGSGGGARPNVVLTREDLGDGETLRGYADRQLIEIARKLRSFKLVGSSVTTVGGAPAVDMRFSWHADVGPIEQRMVMVTRGSTALSFAATAPAGASPSASETLDALLPTVAFAGGPAAAVPRVEQAPRVEPAPPTFRPAARPITAPETAVPPGAWGGDVVSSVRPAAGSIPPPSFAAPEPSAYGTMPPPAPVVEETCDPHGTARGAAAAHWKLEPADAEKLRATDLHALVPWASRHELVAVTAEDERTMVVALGLGDPVLFHESAGAAELGRFFRVENIVLPTGLPAHVLAQAIHGLMRGKAGAVITQAWLERLRGRLLVESPDVIKVLQRHGEPPRITPIDDPRGGRDDGWELVFCSVNTKGAIDRWTVRGDRGRLRSLELSEVAPEGSFDLKRWVTPPAAGAMPSVAPPSVGPRSEAFEPASGRPSPGSGVHPRPPPAAGRGGTRIIPVPPGLPKIR